MADVVAIAHVCGTELDDQGLDMIVAKLFAAGIFVAESNAQAARWAVASLRQIELTRNPELKIGATG